MYTPKLAYLTHIWGVSPCIHANVRRVNSYSKAIVCIYRPKFALVNSHVWGDWRFTQTKVRLVNYDIWGGISCIHANVCLVLDVRQCSIPKIKHTKVRLVDSHIWGNCPCIQCKVRLVNSHIWSDCLFTQTIICLLTIIVEASVLVYTPIFAYSTLICKTILYIFRFK